jgi:hypothetical protein
VLLNPVLPGVYNFTSTLICNTFTYSTTPRATITVYDIPTGSLQVAGLTNIPAESGEQAFYILQVLTSSLNSSL